MLQREFVFVKVLLKGEQKMLKLNVVGWIALALIVIGALNWGLVGVFNGFDLVAAIFGELSVLSRIVYILVGLSAVHVLVTAASACKLKWRETHRPHPA